MKWKNLRRKVLEEFYPEEEEKKELADLFNRISEFIQEEEGLRSFFAGSSGRGTFISGDRDVDVFVMFPEETGRQELEEKGLRVGEKVFEEFEGEFDIEYAEHPYTKGEIEGHEVEIVPCYETDPEDIKSAVDRSPHHAQWVRENLSEEEKKDAVILKAFLRAKGIYGSSLKVRGFSGYLCELLVHEYGGFLELLKAAVDWGEEKFIDPEGVHGGELPEDLREKFSESSLVVIDPVDPERNVASVLTRRNYSKFIFQSWRFLGEKGMNHFRSKEIEIDRFELKKELEKRGDFLVIESERIDEPDDIVYPQMRKTMRRLRERMEKEGFRIFDSGFQVGEKIRVFIEIESELPGVDYRKGPKVHHGTKHLEQFTQKYENVFVEEDRLFAKTEREYTYARELVKDFLDAEEAVLRERGIPGNVAESLQDFQMTEPLLDDEEWLKFLVKKLKVGQ